ncbi:IS66 family transposase [Paracoccus versutus]|nr:IS66 family transposase [Paracoccus versutus]
MTRARFDDGGAGAHVPDPCHDRHWPASTPCPCGCGEMAKIGEDVSERLDIVPAQLRVLVTRRPKYACRQCSAAVVQVHAPEHVVPGGLPAEALIAQAMVAKLGDHLPFYRQAEIYTRQGIALDRATLGNWVGRACFHLRPIVDHLRERLICADRIFMDETRAPVLDPGRRRTRTGYFWAVVSDDRGHGSTSPPVVFGHSLEPVAFMPSIHYAPGRGAVHALRFLEGYCGQFVQCDGYEAYDKLTKVDRTEGPWTLVHCWPHARRRFVKRLEKDGSPIAEEALRQIAELHAIEKTVRGAAPDVRLAARRTLSAPIIAAFQPWLAAQLSRIPRSSKLAEDIRCTLPRWPGLTRFLEDGRLELDTNPVENQIRKIALTRKNALFAGHEVGAENWTMLASLIANCKMNDVDPVSYLAETLRALLDGHPRSRIDKLMPGNFTTASSLAP